METEERRRELEGDEGREERVVREEVVVERADGSVPPPGGASETAIVEEREVATPRADGSVERDTVRVERRQRRAGAQIWPWLLGLLVLLLIGLGVAWYLTQDAESTVPTVEGQPLEAAVARLEDEGLKSQITESDNDAPEGTVYDQVPEAGTNVDEGSTVQLLVSGGPEAVVIPNAVGLTEADARDRLVAAGFAVTSVQVFSDVTPGNVIAQSPQAGTEAETGSSVRINVSKGTGQVDVPDVVGLSRGQAESEVEAAKLVPSVVAVPSDEPEGTVVAQNPVGGTLRQGSTVRINVSAGR